jgi:NAD(P)-dependent dehydrogenase (short-subunit alcohol dehydrogenase family)
MGFLPRPTPLYKRKRATRWQKAVVTGGGSGIGLELCRRLLQEGTAVAVIDRQNSPQAQEELDALAARTGASVLFYEADVTDEQTLRQRVDTLVQELGAPDLVLNCAGIQDARPFEELSGADFERVVAINLCGSRNLAAALLPHMASGSQLALMASLAGLVSNHSYAAYNASKFGVVGLAGALRLEYLPAGIEVSVICPPEVETPMVEQERRSLPAVAAQLKDTAGTLDVATACDQILAQLRRRRVTVIPGWRARGVALLARLLPGVMRRVSERIVLANSSETGRS